MKIYHGTTASVAEMAIENGLLTREASGVESLWEHTVPSAADRVYLSTAYAGYFANNAAQGQDDRWGIVEIDTDLLDEDKLRPDEDFLEQISRLVDAPRGPIFSDLNDSNAINDPVLRMNKRTSYYRDNIHMFSHLWEESVDMLGNCSYQGNIPPEAISRVSIFNPRENKMVYWLVDPTISLMNFRIMGNKYKAITRWLSGYPVSVEDVFMAELMDEEQLTSAEKVLNEFAGLKVISQ